MSKQRVLSKSNYKLGLTCPKSLWTKINHPELLSEIDKGTQRRFDEGQIIGQLAKKLFPKGIEIRSFKYDDVINNTKNELDKRVPLFEAGFIYNNCFTRPDILNPVGKDEWDVIEVKSGTSVKKDHIEDTAFQKYVYENYGLKINKYYIMYLNNEYIKNGEIDINELFIQEDITNDVEKTFDGIEERIKPLLELINSSEYDEVKFGKHCESPKTCPNPELDWKDDLPENNVFELYYGGKKSKMLYSECECIEIKDIPNRIKLSDKQKIQVECIRNNETHISRTNIKNFLNNLDFPLWHMDFETFQSGIPLYDSSKPFQQIPFQFSLHIQEKDNTIEHYEFLAEGKEDPRIKFIENLKDKLGDKGSIIVYNKSFEMSVMKKIGEFLPQYQKWIKELEPRYVDLLDVFRNFWYYNPIQRGSCSIKRVLPALVPSMSYADLEIGNGGDASLEYFYSIFKYTDDKQIEDIRNHLLLYCQMDTLAMVKLIEELEKLA